VTTGVSSSPPTSLSSAGALPLGYALKDQIFCWDVAWVTTGVSSSPPTSLSSAGRRSERQSSSDSPSG